MAQYAALWTSSRDPEFIQIKKVKQLTERYLAMNITDMKEEHRRQVKKAQEHIRENQDTLDRLEKEKEMMARSILARFHRHIRLKETARRMTFNFRKRRESERDQKPTERVKLPKLTKEKRNKKSGEGSRRSKVFWTQTFPYVYHSYGDKPCPRYDMFLESQEFGPPEISSKERHHAAHLTKKSKRPSVFHKPKAQSNENEDNRLPHLPMPVASHPSLKKVSLALQAIQGMKKNDDGVDTS